MCDCAAYTLVVQKYYDQHDKLKEEYKEALQKYKASKPAESAQQVNQADGEKQVAGGPVHLKQEVKYYQYNYVQSSPCIPTTPHPTHTHCLYDLSQNFCITVCSPRIPVYV